MNLVTRQPSAGFFLSHFLIKIVKLDVLVFDYSASTGLNSKLDKKQCRERSCRTSIVLFIFFAPLLFSLLSLNPLPYTPRQTTPRSPVARRVR